MKAGKKKLKLLIFYALMFTLTVSASFLLLEFVVARFFYSGTSGISSIKFDPVLGWRMIPGSYWSKPTHTFKKHRIYINSFGLRNEEMLPGKGEASTRIIVLGDSFTYGEVMPEDLLFTTLLEKRLHKGRQGKYEVVNAGLPGYGSAAELLLLRELSGKNVTADVYLLMLFTNDILDNLCLDYGTLEKNASQPGFALNAAGELYLKQRPAEEIDDDLESFKRARKRSWTPKFIGVAKMRAETFLQTRPALLNLLLGLGFDVKFARMPGLLNGWYEDEILTQGLPLMKVLLREIRDEARAGGAQLLVGFIPSPIQVYSDAYGRLLRRTFPASAKVEEFLGDAHRPQRIVAGICGELGVPCLDLHPLMLDNNERELFFPREGHLSREGHDLVAGELAEFIAASVKPEP
jgi:lysophospholipase L1-like esterase